MRIPRTRKKLRLARIEDECARVRRPPRIRSNLRPVLRAINSCPPIPGVGSPKATRSVQERFTWLKTDSETKEVFCSVCVASIEKAPPHIQCRKPDTRWSLPSPRGRALGPKIELHAFSSLHTWSTSTYGENRGEVPSL